MSGAHVQSEPKWHCSECGYDLGGSLAIRRCPECGRSFDPEDRTTFDARPSPMRRLLSYAATVSALLYTAYVFFACSSPIGPEYYFILFFLLFLGFGLALSTHRFDRVRTIRDLAHVVQPHQSFKLLVVCFIFSLLFLILHPWSVRARFQLSASAFSAEVAQIQASGVLPATPRWIGLYYVLDVRQYGRGRLAFVTGHNLGDRVGFEYSLSGGNRPVPHAVPVGAGWCARIW